MDILDLGVGRRLVPFAEALAIQRSIHQEVVNGKAPNTLIVVEHPSVYTAGRRTRASERPTADFEVVDVDRGGKITWHGPGQLVVYPIMRLNEPLDVVSYVRSLERAVISYCDELNLPTQQIAERSGVWVPSSGLSPFPSKICAIGVRVAQSVTMHGLALNCSNSLEPYGHITACGLRDASVTTISRELNSVVDPAGVRNSLLKHILATLDAA